MAKARKFAEVINAISSLADAKENIIICIDGPAGAGKTTLASEISSAFDSVNIVHMDDLYAGWNHPLNPELFERVRIQIVEPHLQNQTSTYNKYDWLKEKFDGKIGFIPKQILVIEGVGAASSQIRKFANLVVFIEIDETTGLQRVLNRDGMAISEQMSVWQKMENDYFNIDNTKSAANFLVDGTLEQSH